MKLQSTVILLMLLLFIGSCKKEDIAPNHVGSQSNLLDATNINTDTTLQDTGVYIVSNNIQVNANFTIRPGVTLLFQPGAGIQVNEGGSLTAVGTAKNMVLFTSESRGSWRGITVLSNSSENVLSYCKVENGGGANQFGNGNIIIGSGENTAEATISHSEITGSIASGIVVSKGSKLNSFTGNKIHTNWTFPISMYIVDAVNLNDGNNYTNNGKEFIQLTGDSTAINKEITLNHLGEAFMVTGKIISGSKFFIAPGTHIYMGQTAEIIIDGNSGQASFNATGTPSNQIFIQAPSGGTGLWKGIRFCNTESNENKIEYCTISGGGTSNGGNETEGMLSAVFSNIVIRNSLIMNSSAIGVYIKDSEYNSDIIVGNEFRNNVKANVHIE